MRPPGLQIRQSKCRFVVWFIPHNRSRYLWSASNTTAAESTTYTSVAGNFGSFATTALGAQTLRRMLYAGQTDSSMNERTHTRTP